MTGDARSNSLARRRGEQGERDAAAEGRAVRVAHSDLLDGDNEDVKTAQVLVKDQGGLRTGRFRFYKDQHDELVKRDGKYHFRVDTGDGTHAVCDIPARELRIKKDSTLPWTSLPCLRDSREI